MHDGMQYDPIQVKVKVTSPESRKFAHFQQLFPPPFITDAGK